MTETKRRTKDPLKALEYCWTELAETDGSPSKSPVAKSPATGFGSSDMFLGFFGDSRTRLRAWLNRLAEIDAKKLQAHKDLEAATAYSAILQVWLTAHGINWPAKGVFVADFSGGGRGRPVDLAGAKDRRRCHELRAKGKEWKEVAKEVFPGECKTSPDTAKAATKARNYARSYAKQKRGRLTLEDLLEPACELLGITELSLSDIDS